MAMGLFAALKRAVGSSEDILSPLQNRGGPATPLIVNGSASLQPAIAEPDPPERLSKERVLFVGADPSWFQQLKRDLILIQPDWICLNVQDYPSATAALSSASFAA